MAGTPDHVATADRLWAAQLRARHGELIARYARRRLATDEHADHVLDQVFTQAAVNRGELAGPALPWLIAKARGECAALRLSQHPLARGGGPTNGHRTRGPARPTWQVRHRWDGSPAADSRP